VNGGHGIGDERLGGADLARHEDQAAALGLVMELPQFLLKEREPSTTHVFIFIIGGLAGALAYRLAPGVRRLSGGGE